MRESHLRLGYSFWGSTSKAARGVVRASGGGETGAGARAVDGGSSRREFWAGGVPELKGRGRPRMSSLAGGISGRCLNLRETRAACASWAWNWKHGALCPGGGRCSAGSTAWLSCRQGLLCVWASAAFLPLGSHQPLVDSCVDSGDVY